MKVAPAIGQESAPGWSVRSVPNPFDVSQVAPEADAANEAATGLTVFPLRFTIWVKERRFCLAKAYSTNPIEPEAWATLPATPSLPLAPTPTGQSTPVALPTRSFHSELTLER